LDKVTWKSKDWNQKENSRVVNVAILKPFKQPTAETIEQPASTPALPCNTKKGREGYMRPTQNSKESLEAKSQLKIYLTPKLKLKTKRKNKFKQCKRKKNGIICF
jgi:hypothetical protein